MFQEKEVLLGFLKEATPILSLLGGPQIVSWRRALQILLRAL